MSFHAKKKSPFGPPESGGAPTRLNLTALMDILSNIIFFMMATFGAQTLELASAQKVQLPQSTSELSLKMSLAVAVGLEEIYVEDEPIGELKNGVARDLDKSGRFVPSLEKALRKLKAQRLAKNERPKDADDVVLFIADRRLKYTTIEKIMQTCARAGFTKFRFAVNRG